MSREIYLSEESTQIILWDFKALYFMSQLVFNGQVGVNFTEDQYPKSGFSLNNTLKFGLFFTKPYYTPPTHLEYISRIGCYSLPLYG